MTDIFNEYLVKRTPTSKEQMFRALLWGGAVVLSIAGFMLLGLLAVAVIIFIVYFLDKRFNIEYEYVITNGELDIDRIISQNKRKRVLSTHVKNFTLIAPAEDKQFEKEFSSANKILDVGEGKISSTTYYALYEDKGQKIKVIFDPNEKIVSAMKIYAPRQTHIKQ